MNNAATRWIKYIPDSPLSPQLGEWCLWTMEIDGQRDYFSGSLFKSDGKILLNWQGGRCYEPNDTLYYARVNHLKKSHPLIVIQCHGNDDHVRFLPVPVEPGVLIHK